jgi:protein-S-isoprenylcysteine O-methyltransferase Ste14
MPISAYLRPPLLLIIAGGSLFASAGTYAIASFWIYLAIYGAVLAASLVLLDPGLVREQLRPGGKSPTLGAKFPAYMLYLHWIIAGLDVGRLHLSDTIPPWLQAIGLAVFASGYALMLWTMRENRFYSSAIRIQSDRGQYVVTTGPYAYVRHPGDAAKILVVLTSGVALGSWLAAALLIVTSLPFLLYRAITEDRVLLAQLPGYREYAARVHWRLIPGLW